MNEYQKHMNSFSGSIDDSRETYKNKFLPELLELFKKYKVDIVRSDLLYATFFAFRVNGHEMDQLGHLFWTQAPKDVTDIQNC